MSHQRSQKIEASYSCVLRETSAAHPDHGIAELPLIAAFDFGRTNIMYVAVPVFTWDIVNTIILVCSTEKVYFALAHTCSSC